MLKTCASEDLPILLKLSRQTFIDAFAAANDPDDFKVYLNEAFSEARLKAELSNPYSFFYITYVDEEVVGYIKLNYQDAQTDIKSMDGAELERIYVLQKYQNQNLGQWMLEQAIDLVKAKGKQYLWLGVWEENPKAIRFYERHGFEKFGRHPYYIGSDKQIDWLMKLDLVTS
ncbi:MAG: GNAT family N-acetyltransferase [Flavobacteriaceae bacterium]|nr:GNAT family N-acetyltransferase [Flavobacteriaceae bacterium]